METSALVAEFKKLNEQEEFHAEELSLISLDSLQHLVNLAACRTENKKAPCPKISVDVEGYRAKRENSLRALARRMAEKVVKYKKSVMLEPMNPYERRIIHSELQSFKGVSTNSIGSENNRKVVIYLDDQQ